MDTFTLVLLNTIMYMGGIFTGLGICIKYKRHLLLKTSSNDQLNELLTSIHKEVSPMTNAGPPNSMPVAMGSPILPSAPSKEVVIRNL